MSFDWMQPVRDRPTSRSCRDDYFYIKAHARIYRTFFMSHTYERTHISRIYAGIFVGLQFILKFKFIYSMFVYNRIFSLSSSPSLYIRE